MYQKLTEYLKKYEKKIPLNPFAFPSPQKAAVLVLLLKEEGVETILFTKRSEIVEHHKGQICFPGGVYDKNDKTLMHTALRETEEEIGLKSGLVSLLGELGDIFTPSGFQVKPFVGFVSDPYLLTPSTEEIADVFTVPISHLMNSANRQSVIRSYSGLEYHDTLFTFKNHQIWGATGRIIVELLEIMKKAGTALSDVSPNG